jgi:hypothetical protein
MAATYFSLLYGTEGSESDCRLSFTVYGATLEETQAWGHEQAWNYIHDRRPNDRMLKSLQSVAVAPYLLTDSGPQPLDFDEVQKISDASSRRELYRAFGGGASAVIQARVGDETRATLSPELAEPVSLEKMRLEMEKHFQGETTFRQKYLEEINWDPNRQAIYRLMLNTSDSEDWDEVILCRAVNLFHAGRLWDWYSQREESQARRVGVELSSGFHAVGEPLFSLRGRG